MTNDLATHFLLNVDDVEFEPWPIPRGENGITIHGNPEYGGKERKRFHNPNCGPNSARPMAENHHAPE